MSSVQSSFYRPLQLRTSLSILTAVFGASLFASTGFAAGTCSDFFQESGKHSANGEVIGRVIDADGDEHPIMKLFKPNEPMGPDIGLELEAYVKAHDITTHADMYKPEPEDYLLQRLLKANAKFGPSDNIEPYLVDGDTQKMIDLATPHMERILDIFGVDRRDPNTLKTGIRWVKMQVNELLAGRYEKAPDLNVFPTPDGVKGLVSVGNFKFVSECAHHKMPFVGTAHIAYVPGEYMLGISKFKRVTDFFARRMQSQESLTRQIVDFLTQHLGAKGVVVNMEATHECMECRGVMTEGAKTITEEGTGVLEDEGSPLRQKFDRRIMQSTSKD